MSKKKLEFAISLADVPRSFDANWQFRREPLLSKAGIVAPERIL
jgi:hypothetical protein